MRSTIFTASVFAIFAIFFCGAFAEVVLEQPIEVATEGQVVIPPITEQELLQNNFLEDVSIEKTDAVTADIAAKTVTGETFDRPVVSTSTDAAKKAVDFLAVEQPTPVIPAVTRTEAGSTSVTRPRIVEVVRKSIDTPEPVVVDRFFEVLQPTAPTTTDPVEVRPIRVTEPLSVAQPIPSVVNTRFVEVLQPTAPTTTDPVEISPIHLAEPLSVAQPIPSAVNTRLLELLQPTAPTTTDPVEVRPIRVAEPLSVAQPIPSVVNTRFLEVLQPVAPVTTDPVEVRPIRVAEPLSVNQPIPSAVNTRFLEVLQPVAPITTDPVEVRPIRVTEPLPVAEPIRKVFDRTTGRFFVEPLTSTTDRSLMAPLASTDKIFVEPVLPTQKVVVEPVVSTTEKTAGVINNRFFGFFDVARPVDRTVVLPTSDVISN